MRVTLRYSCQEAGMAERGLDRLAVRLLEGLGRQLWGFPPRLMAPIVAELGAVEAVSWFARNMPRYERTLRVLGPLRTHLACTAISLYNGCRYCSYGHAYAAELVYLRERGTVFPVDAHTMAGWTGLEPGELRQRMVEALEQADLHGEVLWVDRTLALASGAQRPVDAQEARVAHLVAMFEVLNAIGKAGDVEPDEAHDPVNKNAQLKARNSELRRSVA
jgi:alkylhydroperoxidase family enzyme